MKNQIFKFENEAIIFIKKLFRITEYARLFKLDTISIFCFKKTGFSFVSGILLLSLPLSGCSTYSSSFGCGDAKGASCRPISVVDQMIDNGEILELHHTKCRYKKCSTLLTPKLNDKESK
ncbi:MAG: hypothetical protein HRU35_01030 [Rickettsiaceae bacterium]|nr:hypothetical protein [Rickettsiaceae bacterium]